jgi:hypothetical protein
MPATTCTLSPAIPSHENLESRSGGTSAKLVCGVPGGSAVTGSGPDCLKGIRVDQNESAAIARQQKTKNTLDVMRGPSFAVFLAMSSTAPKDVVEELPRVNWCLGFTLLP